MKAYTDEQVKRIEDALEIALRQIPANAINPDHYRNGLTMDKCRLTYPIEQALATLRSGQDGGEPCRYGCTCSKHFQAATQSAQIPAGWIEGTPPEDVEVAWIRYLDYDPEGEPHECVALGCRDINEFDVWCVAADWKGESYNDIIEGHWTHWMPYTIPSHRLAAQRGTP